MCWRPLTSADTLGARPCALRRILDARFVCCLIPTLKPIATPPRKEKARRREGGGGTYHLNHPPSKSAPYMGVGLYLLGFDIISIGTRHKTSTRPSRRPGDDSITSRFHSYRCTHKFTPWGVKPSKSAPHMSARSYGAGFCITTIEGHHEISDEPSRTPVEATLSRPEGVNYAAEPEA